MRTLIHGLKTCLNQGGGIQALVDTLSSLSHPKKKTKLQKKREAQNSSKQGESLLWNGRPYQVTGNGWWYWVDDHKTNLGNAKTPTKGFQHEIPTVQHAEYGENSWITNLRFHDWDTAPTLVSIPQIKGSLKKGENAGNITEVWTLNDLDELTSLWKTFEDPQPLTALLMGEAQKKEGVLWTRLTLTRGGWGAKTEQAALLQIGQKKGPWISVTRVNQDSVPKVERTTIRISAPSEFRSNFLPEDAKGDTPLRFSKLFRDYARAKFPTFLGLDGPTKVTGTKFKLSGF